MYNNIDMHKINTRDMKIFEKYILIPEFFDVMYSHEKILIKITSRKTHSKDIMLY